ncbi:MAG: TIGR03087 family PEP-CTERM/XrtA system glycosyltransferase [Alphaproteobacteria bacterium]
MADAVPELLFLAHRIPYPPNKGDKIRSWNILRHLAERYRIHLGCFIDDPHDRQYEGRLREICDECHFATLGPTQAKLRGLAGLVNGEPLTLRCYRDPGLAAWVEGILAHRRPGRVFVFSSAMAQYVMSARTEGVRRVIDFIDVDSDKWRQYAAGRRWPMRWVYRREHRTLLAFDRRVAAAFDAATFVSAAEAALFRRLAPESAGKIFPLNNGVDFAFFSPARAYDDPFGGARGVVVFTGAMDYWANVDAVEWFAREVLPAVQSRLPDTRFCIVGANPTPAVARLAGLKGVEITGRVADVRPYLAHAAAVVAPLRIARGVQNKVLEAMAMAKAVVATPQALEGIDAAPGDDVLVAAETGAFADAVSGLLEGGEGAAIGARARARVTESYDWRANLVRLDELLEGDPAVAEKEA